MSRVIFLTENVSLTPMGRLNADLVRTLLEQGFDVTVLTSGRDSLETLPPQRRLQVLQPFARWSLLELIRLTPVLMHLQPQVVHLGQTEKLRGPTLHLLSGLLQALSRPLTVSSIWDTPQATSELRLLSQMSDHLIVCNENQMRRVKPLAKSKSVHLFPLLRWAHSSSKSLEPSQGMRAQPETRVPFARYVCIPGPLDAHRSLKSLQELAFSLLADCPDRGLVLTDQTASPRLRKSFLSLFEQAHLSHRLFWAPHSFHQAELIALSTLPLESVWSVWSLHQAVASGRPVLLTSEQAASWTLNPPVSEMVIAGEAGFESQQIFNAPESGSDEAGNFLSRLYADGLELKRNHT